MVITAFGYDGSIRIKADLDHNDFDRELSSMTKKVSSFGSILKKLTSTVAVAFGTAAIINFGKEAINAASALNDAWIGLESIVAGQGKSFGKAKAFINDYISDGLVPLENAVTAYKNLAARGYSTEQIEKTLTALKDAAAFGRQASYSLGEAVSSATEGLKNENSILVDNAGVTKNVAKMWDEYAKSIGTTAQNLTQAQKIQAEVNGILEETRFQTGDAAKLVNTYSGQIALLGYNFQQLKVEVGNALIPIAQAVLPGINAIIAALVKLAKVFAKVSAILFGKSTEIKTENNVESSANSAATATDKLAESTAGAGESAKKAEKDLKGLQAGFDELNILAGKTSSSLDGASGGLDLGNTDIEIPDVDSSGEIFGDVTVNPDIEKNIQKIVDRVKELKEIAEEGFEFGFGDTDTSELAEDLKSIGQYLREIFTDEDVQAAANRFVESFVYMVGTLAGALASIGVTIATALVGGLEDYLSKNVDRIKQWIIRMFDVWTEINLLIADFAAAFADIFSVFGEENAQKIVSSIIQIFADIFGGVLEVASKFSRDVIDAITAPFVENKDKIKEALRGFLEPVQKVMEDIAEAVRTTVDGIVSLYDDHIHPFIMNIKKSFTEWFDHMLDGFNTYIKPVLDGAAEMIDNTIKNHVVPMIEKAIEYLGNLYDAITLLWDNVLRPVVSFIIDVAAPAISLVIQELTSTITSFINFITDGVGSLLDIFGGLIEFLTGVFTADWEKTFNGIQRIVSGAFQFATLAVKNIVEFITKKFEGLVGIIKRIGGDIADAFSKTGEDIKTWWNETASKFFTFEYWKDLGLSMIDGLLAGLKKIFNDLGQWASDVWNTITGVFSNKNAKTSIRNSSQSNTPRNYTKIAQEIPASFSVQDLPRLAKGAVIPPNQQFAAILGDQRSGTNIEAPLSTIERALENVLYRSGGSGGSTEVNVNFTGSLSELARILQPAITVETKRVGTKLVGVRT